MHKVNYTVSLFTALLSVATLFLLIAFLPPPSSAISGSDFDRGKIIDDAVFYNSASMNVVDIQAFLNSKVPVCDTNGTKPYGGTTRAAYGASLGYPAPYICLKDYTQTVPTIVNGGSDLCTGTILGGVKSAAGIINDVAKACGINPQILIVTLQKEMSLVTDDWPWPSQYEKATGYGCPDTAPCNAEYFGFFNQVYQTAKAFKRYEANPNSYNYRAGRNNTILYNSNTTCGSSTVFIQNQATANLYIYTPYQPNAGAVAHALDGGPFVSSSFPGCAAYGNVNFFKIFNNWFGSTSISNAAEIESYALFSDESRTVNITSNPVVSSGQKVYARMSSVSVFLFLSIV